MYLVDKQDIARLQTRQHRGQVAGALQHGSGRTLDLDAHFLGDDVGQGGLAKTGGPENEHMIERLTPALGGLDKQLHLLAHAGLANIVGQPVGADRPINNVFLLPR